MIKAYSYVRFSTKGQIDGRSLPRQREHAEVYSEERGLLLQDLSFHDLGVSGFKGKNADVGALGEFIRAVESGFIEQGSWLLIENFDRMSRMPVEEALGLLLKLVSLGIVVVTLTDKQEFRKGELDPNKLMYSLMVMSRAHDESANKSRLLKDAWRKKKEIAAVKPLGANLPAWLHYNSDKTEILVDEPKAEIVRSIFESSAAGWGKTALIRKLNQDGVPPIGSRAKCWHNSYITKILNGRASLGEYQPHAVGNAGKREPVGDVIKGYYPPIINEDLWLLSKAGIQSRRIKGTGATRKGFTKNVFSGFIYCECGAPLHFTNKGSGSKGGKYLICSMAKNGAGCTYVSYRYYETQWVILVALQDLLKPYIRGPIDTSRELILGAERVEVEVKIDRLIKAISEADGSSYMGKQVMMCELRLDEIDTELLKIKSENVKAEHDPEVFTDFTDKLNDQEERLMINKYLQRRLDKIVLYKDRAKIDIKVSDEELITLQYDLVKEEWTDYGDWQFQVRNVKRN
jgi:DNA invertase Pin-like site-specific DNA recombinase